MFDIRFTCFDDLYGNLVPITVSNFKSMCTGVSSYDGGREGVRKTRIWKMMMQDVTKKATLLSGTNRPVPHVRAIREVNLVNKDRVFYIWRR
ncbi:hypothetical protein L1887_10971 [Cichorium endivia]|nr:hypothetical protein L1887_10971 [Cichorium endivia]